MAQPEIQVTPLQAEVSVEEFVKTCVDIPKFYACCEACPNFQKRWSCPPFSFSVEELWASFHTLVFYGKKIHTPSDWLGQQYSPQEMAERYRLLLAPVKEQLLTEILNMEQLYPGSLALSAGSCNVCGEEKCTRAEGKPCCKPEKMRYSIESLGGDVGKSIETYLGENLIWANDGQLPPHFILLAGLLKK